MITDLETVLHPSFYTKVMFDDDQRQVRGRLNV
jgi:hypothetical protein